MRADALPTLRRVLRDHRRGFAIWAAALAAITFFYMSFWPTMGQAMRDALEGMPQGLMAAMGYDRIDTGAGYLEAVVYGLLGPVLLLVHGIALGARLIAGQEEDGTLELDFAAPLGRARLYWERLAAAWLLVTGLVVAITLAVFVSNPIFDLNVSPANVSATGVGLWLLVGGFVTIAFAIGAATGRRGVAVGATAGLAVIVFVFRGVANAAGIDAYAALSPLSWLLQSDPLANGLDLVSALKLVAITVIAAPVGLWRFLRRDLMT